MKNVFENSCLGRAYRTRDDKRAIYLRTFVSNGCNYCVVSTGELEYSVKEDGKVDKNLYPYAEDIISEWEEPINEEPCNIAGFWASEYNGCWTDDDEAFIDAALKYLSNNKK